MIALSSSRVMAAIILMAGIVGSSTSLAMSEPSSKAPPTEPEPVSVEEIDPAANVVVDDSAHSYAAQSDEVPVAKPSARRNKATSIPVPENRSQKKNRSPVRAEGREETIQEWLKGLKPRAIKMGIIGKEFDEAVNWITIDWGVYDLTQRQPEFSSPMGEYINRRVSDKNVQAGRMHLLRNIKLMDEIELRYGVERSVLAAIWSIETRYGEYMGDRNVLRSLATLGYMKWRGDFPVSQLLAAILVAQENRIDPKAMKGSFAGAMGHTQFIPTTYLESAVDFDGDNVRDLWDSPGDALASAANYLRKSGWKMQVPWGWQVVLPLGFDYMSAKKPKYRSGKEWQRIGVRTIDGSRLDLGEVEAYLLLPTGAQGPVFLVTRNFESILRYNRAVSYALSVAMLSDRIRAHGGMDHVWPADGFSLQNASQRREMQELLNKLGYDVGAVDGIIGTKTRGAVADLQVRLGLSADGHPSVDLLRRARNLVK